MCWREKRTLTWKGLKQSGNSPRTFSKLPMYLMSKPKSCSGGSLTEWCNKVGGSPTSSCLQPRRRPRRDHEARQGVQRSQPGCHGAEKLLQEEETRTFLPLSLIEEQSLSGRETLSREIRLLLAD